MSWVNSRQHKDIRISVDYATSRNSGDMWLRHFVGLTGKRKTDMPVTSICMRRYKGVTKPMKFRVNYLWHISVL
jgi:hypothetical protein